MKILVPVKRVPDPTQKAKIKDGHLDLSGASWIVNTFDEYAIETALRLVENGADNTRAAGAEIIAITIGPDDAAKELRTCLAMGADHAMNYKTQDWSAEVWRLTGKKGVDVVLDMVGGDYVPRNLRSLANDGRLRSPTFVKGAQAQDRAVIDPQIAETLRTMLETVVHPPGGGIKAAITNKSLSDLANEGLARILREDESALRLLKQRKKERGSAYEEFIKELRRNGDI